MLFLTLLVGCFVLVVSNNQDDENYQHKHADHHVEPPLVQTAEGWLRGSIMKTYTGRKIYAFRGVRFAEPPVGENRFKPPVPVKPWQGEYDASADKLPCVQPYLESVGPVSEDCLHLNVYSKKLSAKHPVIVFFHPGGFVLWSGRSRSFGPQYLLNRDVVLVTTNYRLGPQGFLSTGDKTLRGNYGMKDQVAVLRWVKQNIAKFGGDPDSVTIMGYSAGSASVELHLLSPMSKGLFHRAIAMSGSATASWAITRNPMYLAREMSKYIGCEGVSTSQQVYDCVKEADAELLANRSLNIRPWRGPPSVVFSPVVEKDYGDGEERFLTDEPLELLKRGEINSVPLIISVTANELDFNAYFIVNNEEWTRELNEDFNKVAPKVFRYIREGPLSVKISQALKKFYFNDQRIDNDTRIGLGQLITDCRLIFPQVQAAKLFAEKSTQPVYMYFFSYIGRYSFRYIPGTTTPEGAAHHDDLIYLFYISRFFPEFNGTDPDTHMVNTLTTTWTEFARTGVPRLPNPSIKWNPMTPQQLQFLEIGNDLEGHPIASISLKMVPGVPYQNRMDLWESLFPLSGPPMILW